MIEYKEFTPKHQLLVPYIKSYTSSIGSLPKTQSSYITRALPSFFTQFYFEFSGNLGKKVTKSTTQTITKRTYLQSGITSWFDIYGLKLTQKRTAVKNFKVELYPHALYEVFNISTKELLTHDLKLEDIWDYGSLYEELEAAKSAQQMIDIFEKHFINQILKNPPKKEFITPSFLQKHTSLKELSQHTGYSIRWIQQKHNDIFGFSFKQFQENRRFLTLLQKLHQKALQNKAVNLSLLAHECGYYDQAHCIKAFKKFSGFTPKVYIDKFLNANVAFFW